MLKNKQAFFKQAMYYSNYSDLKSFLKQKPKRRYTIGALSSQPIVQTKLDRCFLSIVKNDLTVERVDAIVNAANNYLAHGGGVAGAICRKGGYQIQDESDDIIRERKKIPNGESVTTSAGKLACKYVIHTVGPVWRDGESNEISELRKCMATIFQEARRNKVKTLSIPAISSGIFGLPKDICAQVLIDEAQLLLKSNEFENLEEVRFCNFDDETVEEFLVEFEKVFLTKKSEDQTNHLPPHAAGEQKIDDSQDIKKAFDKNEFFKKYFLKYLNAIKMFEDLNKRPLYQKVEGQEEEEKVDLNDDSGDQDAIKNEIKQTTYAFQKLDLESPLEKHSIEQKQQISKTIDEQIKDNSLPEEKEKESELKEKELEQTENKEQDLKTKPNHSL